MIRRLFRPFWAPVDRYLARTRPVADHWERLSAAPGLRQFGPGARLDFSEYLTGSSNVDVSSVDAMRAWLLECEYASDETLFNEHDFWQHPVTFERMRAGDCEDFAIWAWRKLLELGVDADFVTGYCVKDGALDGRHAWVLFRQDGIEYLFEPGARRAERMLRRLDDVRSDYLPQFGVDRRARPFSFAGYLVVERMRGPRE